MGAIVKEERIGGQRLILGDCLKVMPEIGRFDAVVTDPPYGIGITKSNRLAISRGMGGKEWDDIAPDILKIVEMDCSKIIWGGNYFNLPAYRAPLVWDKNNAGRDFADFELAWTNIDMVARRFVMRPMNMDGGKQHPTQKPIALMEWCLGFLPDATTILDPFMGSGTTIVACQRMGAAWEPASSLTQSISRSPASVSIKHGRSRICSCRTPRLSRSRWECSNEIPIRLQRYRSRNAGMASAWVEACGVQRD